MGLINSLQLFEVIESNLSQKYEDGRKLGNNELYGGYFVDIHNDLFIAFRFIDGGHDALGRTGVVITNWAVTQYSKILGKNIKPLFDRLTIKQMPIDGMTTLYNQNHFQSGHLMCMLVMPEEEIRKYYSETQAPEIIEMYDREVRKSIYKGCSL